MPDESEQLQNDLKFLKAFADDLSRWAFAEMGAENARRALERGDATNPKDIEQARAFKQTLMARQPRAKALLAQHGKYHPIVLVRGDGTEEHHDPFDNLFSPKLQGEARSFVSRAARELADEHPDPQSALMNANLDTARQKTDEAFAALEALKNTTPEEDEPIAAALRSDVLRLVVRIDVLEAKLAAQKRWWRKLVEPGVALVLAGALAAGLAYYVHSEIRTTLTTDDNIKLIDAQLNVLHAQGQPQQLGQQANNPAQSGPNHAAAPAGSAPP
jgi:hypothetical protein